jgi:hypothetical protein
MLSKEHKQLLKALKLEYIKRTAPGFFEASGGYNMLLKRYDDRTANGLTNCVYDFITHVGGYCNRVNTTGLIRKIRGEMKWTAGNSNKGAFDLRFVYQGKSGDVEIKIGRDRLSEAQEKEYLKIIKAGGLALIAKDFASFVEWWKEVGFTIPDFSKIEKNR